MRYRELAIALAVLSVSSSALTVAQTGPVSPACQAVPIACPIRGGCASVVRSSPFGLRRHPTTGKIRMHEGTDFAVEAGTPIVAAASGTVITSSPNGSFGNHIIVRHDDGYSTLYAHLDRRLVEVGSSTAPTRVNAGQQIALSDGEAGNPGRGTSTGAHLHFEYYRKASSTQPPEYVDPDPCIANATTLTYQYSGFPFNGNVSGGIPLSGRMTGFVEIEGIWPGYTGTIGGGSIRNFEFTDGSGRTVPYRDEDASMNTSASITLQNGQIVDWRLLISRSHATPSNQVGTFLESSFIQMERAGRNYDKIYFDIASIRYRTNYLVGNVIFWDYSDFRGGSDRLGTWSLAVGPNTP